MKKIIACILCIILTTPAIAFAQEVQVGKQVQIVADVNNSQDRTQPFAYIVSIQDQDGVTVYLAWLTGSLSPNQSLSPALSWTPEKPQTYTAIIYVWESIDNPDALSPPLELKINAIESSA